MRKSLNDPDDVAELKQRLLNITETTERKWGRMNSAQMLCHCDKILQVGIGKIVLPRTNFLIRTIGVCAKIEMKIFSNGIPPNMPTFEVVKLKENCNFEESRDNLFATLDEFVKCLEQDNLLAEHVLFGKMSRHDWGSLQYTHINHHLNQFGV